MVLIRQSQTPLCNNLNRKNDHLTKFLSEIKRETGPADRRTLEYQDIGFNPIRGTKCLK